VSVQAVPRVRTAPTPQQGTQPAGQYADLWDRLRAGFRLPQIDGSLVAAHTRRFAGDPDYLARICERASRYLHHIVGEVEKRNMPLEIALLPAIESAYHPHAHSRARAMGLWQFIAPTARHYGIRVDWWYDGRRDVLTSTRAALDYLQKLHDDFNGDWFLALAAYNAGEGGIRRRIGENRRHGRATGYQDLRLSLETRNYVPKLMAFVKIVSNPGAYGITLPSIPDAPYFAAVDAGSQIDLTVVSQLAGVPVADLRTINPAFNRIATPPDGPHQILVPANRKEALVDGLRNLPEDARVRWRRHHVRSGDTLGAIARQNGVSVQELQRANELRGTLIRAGRDLMIPISSQPFSLRAAQAAIPPAISPAPSSGRTKVEHRVREGETLWGIARHYDVHVVQLAEWNSISAVDPLHVEQKLEIWTPTKID
jgi:membrane-bound lytic murein transglycosylase D